MSKKLLSLYGLKFNPFSPQVPTDALWVSAPVESFCWRIEQQIGEGGFALALGDPGTGKSAALRILAERLEPDPRPGGRHPDSPPGLVGGFLPRTGSPL
jgi:type II secretory pathway predicted ATPase ExeA